MSKSELERAYLTQCRMYGLPEPEREYKAIDGRKYKWDFYFRQNRLLVEIQGGIWLKMSGHNTGKGIERDAEKLNLATCAGFNVLQITAKTIKNGMAMIWTMKALEKL